MIIMTILQLRYIMLIQYTPGVTQTISFTFSSHNAFSLVNEYIVIGLLKLKKLCIELKLDNFEITYIWDEYEMNDMNLRWLWVFYEIAFLKMRNCSYDCKRAKCNVKVWTVRECDCERVWLWESERIISYGYRA